MAVVWLDVGRQGRLGLDGVLWLDVAGDEPLGLDVAGGMAEFRLGLIHI